MKKNPIIEPKIISKNQRIVGTQHLSDYKFTNGKTVPIFQVDTMHALNQILGYAKFINREYGSVLYRGQNKLYPTLLPSLLRDEKIRTPFRADKMNEFIHRFTTDEQVSNYIKVYENTGNEHVEGMLQHYGAKTRCVDLVDNHWVALWMGLYKRYDIGTEKEYNHYEMRKITFLDKIQKDGSLLIEDTDLYQYLLLVAIPLDGEINSGIYKNQDVIAVDLRQALPSTFLRPHAQHAWVAMKNINHEETHRKAYDMASNVVGILRIRIDKAAEWIGGGTLMTQENLFPPEVFDDGYKHLLRRKDLFKNTMHEVARYI